MEYEVDYLPVGEGSKGGDAIALRYGDLSDPQKQIVVIIDGGTKESGKELVNHVKEYYKTNFVDLVVSTHLHRDHASGLTEVLNGLNVGKLAMHLPWDHAANIKSMFSDGRVKVSTIETKLEKSLITISELQKIAEEKKIEIIEPFAGVPLLENLFIIGPSKEYYEQLLANFENTPKIKEEFNIAIDTLKTIAEKTINWVKEEIGMDTETLRDSDEDTTPENNTSVILLLIVGDKKLLFTGDSGKGGLYKAIQYTANLNVPLNDLTFLDVPHHGSRRNIEPSILAKIDAKTAFISAPREGDPKHPSRKVVNALIRRNTNVITTKNGIICHHSPGAPIRNKWQPISSLEIFPEVEE